MSETQTIAQWIYSTLKSGTALCSLIGGTANPRIYADVAPESVTKPYVVFQNVWARDLNAASTHRAATETEWSVFAVAASESYSVPNSIYALCDGLLHGAAGSVPSSGMCVSCRRTEEIRYTHVQDGKMWRFAGGMYRIIINTGG